MSFSQKRKLWNGAASVRGSRQYSAAGAGNVPANYHYRCCGRSSGICLCQFLRNILTGSLIGFYRVDKSRSKAVGGTGLGLSNVTHAAAIHHARVEVESEVETGTEI